MSVLNKVIKIGLIIFLLFTSDSLYKLIYSQNITTSEKKEMVYPWKFPDETQIPAGLEGEYIRYGRQLINETYKFLGPEVKDVKMRFAGSNMSCKNCHLAGGTKQFTAGYIGVLGRFPQYRSRSNSVITIENRINDCFERSLNGKHIPLDSKEMKSIVFYMKWLSTDVPVGAKVDGQGLINLPLLNRAASPDNGKKIFMAKCISCHGINGLGIKKGKSGVEGYIFPPLWGKDSYNDGAAIHRLITATKFIKANMPFGAPNLTLEEAYDVASYINSHERPKKSGLEKDFPVLSDKPVDTPYPPYNDKFSLEQHKVGPFKPMIKEIKK